MNRRGFLAGLLLSAAMARAEAREHAKLYRLAIVVPITLPPTRSDKRDLWQTLLQELRQLGYVEGQNLVVEWYFGEGRREHFPELARDVARLKPDVIFTISVPMAQAFKAATTTVPIVGLVADPIRFGLIENLARPGGNLTGITQDAGTEIWGKRLELLKEVNPNLSKVGFLGNRLGWEGYGRDLQHAAQQLGCFVSATALLEGTIQETDLRRVLAAMAQDGADGLMATDMPESFAYGRLIVDLAETHRLAAIFPDQFFTQMGGLMSFGVDGPDLIRHAADQIDQILKGANPGEIPFYQAAKFKLAINLRTAKALSFVVPPSLLVRADEVVESQVREVGFGSNCRHHQMRATD